MDISKKARDEFMKFACVEMMKERIRKNSNLELVCFTSEELAKEAVEDASALWDALLEDLLSDVD